MIKADVIERLYAIYRPVQALVMDLTPAQLDQGVVTGAWTIKDIVAHLAFWDQNMINILKSALKLEPRKTLTGSADEINAGVYAEYRLRPGTEVLQELNQTLRNLIAAVEMFTDEDLNDPGRFEIAPSQSLGEYIVQEVSGHFHDHMADLRHLRNTVNP